MFDVFFSFNHDDRREVESLARQLADKGVQAYVDSWYLTPGRPWPELLNAALEESNVVAVLVGRNGLDGWQQREAALALDLQAADPRRVVIPVLLPGAQPVLGFLKLNTWVDIRSGIDVDGAVEALARAVRGEPMGGQPDTLSTSGVSPYRGLQPFREEDAPLFFGRDVFVDRLVAAVEQRSVVAVVGPSGSGKSSVVMAGLVPRLRQDPSARWEIASLIPGDRPMHSIAGALLRIAEPAVSTVESLLDVGRLADSLLTGEDLTIRELAVRALSAQVGTDKLLLLIDQWEELYTLNGDANVVRLFIDSLLEASTHPDLSVLLTMRADFYDRALGHRALADALQSGVVNISAMEPAELAEAMLGPLGVAGERFERGLVTRVLADVGAAPGNLPLLEFVLDELWKARV